MDARENLSAAPHNLTEDAVRQMSSSRGIARPAGEAFDAILAALTTHRVDLMIVPCPFGRSFEKVGQDSVGTVMDVLLSRCRTPTYVVRRGDQPFAEASKRVCMLVGAECEVEYRAASWAFGLAGDNAEVSLNLVVENEHFENVRSILRQMHPSDELTPSQLGGILVETHRNLHTAMVKTAEAGGYRYSLIPQAGELAPPNPLSQTSVQLLVMPLEVDDQFIRGFVQERLRRSPHPVLIVPGNGLSS